jgi:hypothetical protein
MYKKKILIIGFGSIGNKYFKILNKYFKKKVHAFNFSKKITKKNLIITKKKIDKINPDYFILCTPSHLHYEHLKFICKNYCKKVILCEKPLFLKPKKINLNNNEVFVGYNLRFHPVVNKAKKIFEKKKVEEVYIHCSTFMPKWRKKKFNYSFSHRMSGGVLFDLSHEIDYFTWIFGALNKKFSIFKKLSKMKMTSKDTFFINGNSSHCKKVLIFLDFISNIDERFFIVKTKTEKFIGNINKNSYHIISNNGNKNIKKIYKNFSIMNSLKDQVKDVFFSKVKKTCTFDEGFNLVTAMNKLNK